MDYFHFSCLHIAPSAIREERLSRAGLWPSWRRQQTKDKDESR
jgi:hypothetical protein